MNLKLRNQADCTYDLVSLGEVMLRFDPGDGKIRHSHTFQVWEGGGEYNTAKGLSRCYGLKTAIVTALVDNEVGRLIESLICQGKVDNALINWVPDDGFGRENRNGIYFLERGFGIRGGRAVFDRGNTPVSKLKKGDINWESLFRNQGARWFHSGGIFAALSDSAPEVIEEAMSTAKKHGTIVSYDLNYRPALWQARGGKKKHQEITHRLLPYVDLLFGADLPEDYNATSDLSGLKESMAGTLESFDNLAGIATTWRKSSSASINDYGGFLLTREGLYEGQEFIDLPIFDRVGSGDCFASGLIFGLLKGIDPTQALNYGLAHSALTMTTPGDTSMVSQDEVESVMQGQGGVMKR
jgi:2-dehydro-3-deoxygluconokinase